MPILTPQDKEYLEKVYAETPYPSNAEYKALAKKLDRHIVMIKYFFEVRQKRYLPARPQTRTRPQQRSRSQPGPQPSRAQRSPRAQPSRRPQRATPSQSQPSQPAQGSIARSISETINVPAEAQPFLEFLHQFSDFTGTDPPNDNPQANHQGTPSRPFVTNHQSIGQQSDQQSLEPNSVVPTNQIPNEQEEHSMHPLDLSQSSYI